MTSSDEGVARSGLRADDLSTVLTSAERLLRSDIEEAVQHLSPAEVRWLVDAYYSVQDFRIQASNEKGALDRSGEPNRMVSWLLSQMERLEGQVKRMLDVWSDTKPVGRWSKAQVGIGPVLAAGLLAHIDIEKAPTVGHIWSFAGLDPTKKWKKGEKRPWNARLKVIAWKCGESFTKVSGRDDALYGRLYRQRKELEEARNAAGAFADQAAATLADKKIGKETQTYGHYAAGKLPPARILLRAQRWAVKIFLAHWHEAAYVDRFHKMPPKPYVLDRIPGHTTEIRPEHMEEIEGWRGAR